MVFRKLGIIEAIVKAIEGEKFEKPSEIQEKTIPFILEGKDVIAGSATGSGKTLAFAAGIIQKCEKGKGIQSLILTPTRELADQISIEMKKFSRFKHLEIAAVYGGVSINPQIDALMSADIVVGTPGRILDHIERKTIRLYEIKILVLDEADRMLDMGFIQDVDKIVRHCPEKRQTLLFSATISSDIAHLAKKYMHNPELVSAEEFVDPKKMHQVYYDVPDNMKFSLLVHLLKNEKAELVMVFCNTQHNTDFVANNLRYAGIDASAIHGGFSQDKRSRVMKDFHSKTAHVLVCTDVAARGLDIKGVSHVYNYDTTKEAKAYIHRIGRTARAGEEGKAISLIASRDYDNFSRVINENNLEIKKEEVPYIQKVELRWFGKSRFGGSRFGRRDNRSGGGNFRRDDRRSFGRERRDSRDRESGREERRDRFGRRDDRRDRRPKRNEYRRRY